MLNVFIKAGVFLFLNKSFIFYNSVKLLGFLIDGFGITTIKDKVKAIRKLKIPDTLNKLKNYVGLIRYLQKFILYYIIKIKLL